ncbi:DUF3306 domain-containing protein [Oxalicibacterium solurbis]|uniref:DUF3306 domain-containing protein n=1 Tax=Oxalicibacterium solurbis TaxID=69280 RepID=A0A8J3B3Y4_9BURK|nr:DUF3306 domain-containing protein [Oxalicibacterium solurbis]GGI54653.1 hypothetical protein GCM10011430_18270 [Oxalicibacterium solurbis]
MAAEEFFARWAKKKTEAEAPTDTLPISADLESPAGGQRGVAQTLQTPQDRQQAREDALPPTMEDVARLTRDSDYSPFMAKGVDETVKRSAMKKLFSDPHFNVMDGLDVYIEDFTKFEPISPAMLASLSHAKELLNPTASAQSSLMRLLDASEQTNRQISDAADDDANTMQNKQEQVPLDAAQQISDAGKAKPPEVNETIDAMEDTARTKAEK